MGRLSHQLLFSLVVALVATPSFSLKLYPNGALVP
jgi:hypothetical protein